MIKTWSRKSRGTDPLRIEMKGGVRGKYFVKTTYNLSNYSL
jgi:hypothetical protein